MYKLLVVDDEGESRNLLCSYFPWGDLGFEIVDQLENGKLALEYILSNPVDVILCDIKMPFLDGIGLAKEIYDRNIKTKIIFLSAYKDFEYARNALTYGVSHYIVKPSKYNEIFEVFSSLKKTLDNECSSNKDVISDMPVNDFKDLSNYDSKIISFVKNYVTEHYKNAKLEDIAESVHMNPNYLSQFFKQKTGECFSNYLIRIKMNHAAKLLDDIRYKTYEVSEMVGYSNTKNFTRTFKNFYGKSPKEYRNQRETIDTGAFERWWIYLNKNFFIKNLIIFLLPILIPTFVLGSLSIIITQRYIKNQITVNNADLLNQTKSNIDLIFNELDPLNIQFDYTPSIALTLKNVSKEETLLSSDLINTDKICFFLNSFANSKPYIYSIHIYYKNENGRFYTTNNGITNLNNYFDTSWYKNYLNHKSDEKMWIEARNIKQYDFEEKETKLITVYKRMALNNGVIVLNIKADYIQNLLNKAATAPEQKIFILDDNANELISNNTSTNITNFDTNELLKLDNNILYSPSEKRFLSKSIIHSDKFSWNYISIIPEDILYNVSMRLFKNTIALLIVSFILG